MDVFLTEQEVERERDLFSPEKPEYKSLNGEVFDIRNFKEEVRENGNMPQPPSSC